MVPSRLGHCDRPSDCLPILRSASARNARKLWIGEVIGRSIPVITARYGDFAHDPERELRRIAGNVEPGRRFASPFELASCRLASTTVRAATQAAFSAARSRYDWMTSGGPG